MVKITVGGQEVPRIVTSLEVPQPVELIKQSNGQSVSVETCSALTRGAVDPAGDSEAAELVRWLWEDAGNPAAISPQWNGWQAAAWIATNDLTVVSRLARLIEFRGKAGSWAGERPTLHAGTMEACLRWEIATRYCQCGADRDGGFCLCLDGAFGKLNAALRDGEVIELGQQSLGPVHRENARGMLFARRSVEAQSSFRLVAEPVSFIALIAWIAEQGHGAVNPAYSAHRKHFGPAALSRDAFRALWGEDINPSRKRGPRAKS